MYTIALADDHTMLRKAIVEMLQRFGYQVVLEVPDGDLLIEKLKQCNPLPQIVLLDIFMPGQTGYEVCRTISLAWPQIKVLALSMSDDEYAVMQMLQAGARGFISKTEDPAVLKQAIDTLGRQEYYLSERVTGTMALSAQREVRLLPELSKKELVFLRYNCSDLTYKEIANRMFVSPRTVENYRNSLYEKFQVKNRLSLALVCIRLGIVKP